MPVLFKMSYKHSPVSGMGLFAQEDIPKGSVWWVFDNEVKGVPCQNAPNLPNLVLDQQSSKKLVEGKTHEELHETLEHTMYYADRQVLLVLRDGSGVINHSFEPNSQISYNEEKKWEMLKSVTLRDIKAGEEMFQNYNNYPKLSKNWSQDFLREHMPSRLEFQSQFGIKKISHD